MARNDQAQLSFTDLEFQQQGIQLDPELQTIADFLDQHHEFITHIRADLLRGLKQPDSGRDGLTPSQVLRCLVLMRIKNWNLRELRDRIADGYVLRRFADFRGHEPVPKHDAFSRSFHRLTPQTMRKVNDFVVHTAVDLGVEDGNQLRVDSTVVQTNVHYPTDSTLLWDVVRVLTRLVHRLFETLGRPVSKFSNRSRAVRRRMQEILRMSPQQRHAQQTRKYRQLVGLAEEAVAAARSVLARTENARVADPLQQARIRGMRQAIEHFCQLGDRVLDQTRRRVFDGETVPAEEKVYSIFEDHTDLIKRGKAVTPVEFGHKVLLAESAQGLITYYEVLNGNPPDEQHLRPVLENHRENFGHVPQSLGADRGFYSEQNLKTCKKKGVKMPSIPQRGGQKTPERLAYEKSAAFKKMQRFRAGIEGRISVLFRGRGMKRCFNRGRIRFEVFVGGAVLANNLLRIADLIRKSLSCKKKAA
jgi:transposase, IS5 family